MKSINQINAQIERNPTIAYYRQLEQEYNKYRMDNWRHRSFDFNLGRGTTSYSITGHFLYIAAEMEMNDIVGTGRRDWRDYSIRSRSKSYDVYWENRHVEFTLYLEQGFYGTRMKVVSWWQPFQEMDQHCLYFKVKSNQTFEQLDIAAYFEKHIIKHYLHAPGLFRNVQIMYRCNKKDAVRHYRELLRDVRAMEPDPIDVDKAWRKLFKKRLNILLEDHFHERKLKMLLYTLPKQSTRMKLFQEPSPFELHDMYHQEHDTEEPMAAWLDNYYESEYPKNSMFA